jgi:hypothetical protein
VIFCQGLAEEELRDQQDATFNRFSLDVSGNSTAEASENSDSDLQDQGEHTVVMTGDMNVVDEELSGAQPMIQFKSWENTWT